MIATAIAWISSRVATWGLTGFLGFLGPVVAGIAQVGGAIITAIAEIIMALAKSPEGRVVLGITAVGLGSLYFRFHFIEEGRAQARAVAYAQGVAAGKAGSKCAAAAKSKGRGV